MDDAVVEELAQIKTLRGIVAWIDDHADAAPVPAAAAACGGAGGRGAVG